jgi:disulfide bond formation protein DsbB
MKFLIISLLLTILITFSACGGNQVASSASGGEGSAADPVIGQQLFLSNCSTCHGPAGEGITALGKPLTTSDFIDNMSDADLLAFIKSGRLVDDPLNTTGIAMPPKGGNPALTDEQLQAIIAYIRSIHRSGP